MNTSDKMVLLFTLRRHKLVKAVLSQHTAIASTNDIVQQYMSSLSTLQQNIIHLLYHVSNPTCIASSLVYVIQHYLEYDIASFSDKLLEELHQLLLLRSGRLIAFVIYRLCLRWPDMIKGVETWLKNILKQSIICTQYIMLVTDLYLYGIPILFYPFFSKVFLKMQQNILNIIPTYYTVLLRDYFFTQYQQKKMSQLIAIWIAEYQANLNKMQSQLLLDATNIQYRIIQQECSEEYMNQYEYNVYKYEKYLYHLQDVIKLINPSQPVEKLIRVKSIFYLKKECETFLVTYKLQYHQRYLYFHSEINNTLRCSRKMLFIQKLSDNYGFVMELKHCNSLYQSFNYSSYFIEQFNSTRNREYLVYLIINYCQSLTNLSYIVKILAEICQVEQSLKHYCYYKARKICSYSKMNPKYQVLICELSKFNIIDSPIILDYIYRLLSAYVTQNTIQYILTIVYHLGPIVYHNTLTTHIRINNYLNTIQTIIHNKCNNFTVDNLFQVKCLCSYLSDCTKDAMVLMYQDEMSEIYLKTNFDFIVRKCSELIKFEEYERVCNYVVDSVELNDYISSYYYASLLQSLHSKKLNACIYYAIHSKVLTLLSEKTNVQSAVKWSRFLGYLYNYEIIKEKMMVETIRLVLEDDDDQCYDGRIQCICATLYTSKYYLIDCQTKNINQYICMFLINLKDTLLKKKLTNVIIEHEINEIIEFLEEGVERRYAREREEFTYDRLDIGYKYSGNIDYGKMGYAENGCDRKYIKYVYKYPSSTAKRFVEKKVEKYVEKYQQIQSPEQHPVSSLLTDFRRKEYQHMLKNPQNESTGETINSISPSYPPRKKIKVISRASKTGNTKQ